MLTYQFKKYTDFIFNIIKRIKMNHALALSLLLIFRPCQAGVTIDGPSNPGAGFIVAAKDNGVATKIYISNGNEISCLDAQNGKQFWSLKTPYGTIDVGPILIGKVLVYVGGGGHFTIYGVDVDTGLIKWTINHRVSIIASGDGKIFVNTQFGNGVVSFNANDGKKVWEYEQDGPGSQDRLMYYHGRVYATNCVLDAKTGKSIRRYKTPARAMAQYRFNISIANNIGELTVIPVQKHQKTQKIKLPKNLFPAGITLNSHFLFTAMYDGYPDEAKKGVLYGFSLVDGSKKWTHKIATKNEMGLPYNSIICNDRQLFVSLREDFAHGMILESLNIETGKIDWIFRSKEDYLNPIVVVGKEIYLHDGAGQVIVLEAISGKRLRILAVNNNVK